MEMTFVISYHVITSYVISINKEEAKMKYLYAYEIWYTCKSDTM